MKKRLIAFIVLLGVLAGLIPGVGAAAQEVGGGEAATNAQQWEMNTHLPDYTELYGLERRETAPITLNRRARSASPQQFAYLAVMVEFTDQTSIHLDDAGTLSAADQLMNSGGEMESTFAPSYGGKIPILSLKDYMYRYSYGNALVTTGFFPQKEGKVVSSVAPHDLSYYLRYDAVHNPNGYRSGERFSREQELIDKAMADIKASVESTFTPSQLDSNNDGLIDAITFFVESPSGADIQWSDLLWSHKTQSDSSVKIHGKSLDIYNLIDAQNPAEPGSVFSWRSDGGGYTVNRAAYSVIQHEYLHSWGLPDLYRGTSGGSPVDFYDIMAANNPQYPQAMLAYMQRDYLGWADNLEEVKTTQTVTIQKPTYQNDTEKRAVKVISPLSSTEFFVVEYYEPLQYAPPYYTANNTGLIVYRIDTSKSQTNQGATEAGGEDYLYVFRPGETVPGAGFGSLKDAVIPARSGAAYGKPYTGPGGGWDSSAIYFSNGSNSGVTLKITGATAASVTVEIGIPGVQGTGTRQDPYLIQDSSSFEVLRNNASVEDTYYKLTGNIDFSGVDFKEIERFSGHLDGNGKTLKNITIQDGCGLFSMIDYVGSVENLKISNLNITCKEPAGLGNIYIGGLAGSLSGKVNNVTLESGMTKADAANQAKAMIGGLAGTASNSAVISNTGSYLQTGGASVTGGFVGLDQGAKYSNCFAAGKVGAAAEKGGFFGKEFSAVNAGNSGCFYSVNGTGLTSPMNGAATVTGVRGIGIEEAKIRLDQSKGATKALNYTVYPSGASKADLTVTFKSGNPAVAAVDQAGKVSCVGVGKTSLNCSLKTGSAQLLFGTVPVEVYRSVVLKPITAISLNRTSAAMNQGEKLKLTATLTPADTTDSKTVSWSSSNTKVATVDSAGNVTAKGAGAAVIRATAANGKKAECAVTVTAPKPTPSIRYNTHVENVGWQGYASDGGNAGTTGRGLRLEGMHINLANNGYGGGIEYRTHIQNIGWESGFKANGSMTGTSGRGLRLEAIQIRLTGGVSQAYDVYYRVHAENFGWLDWAKNGQSSGTAGYGNRLEAIQIKLVKKGAAAPGSTVRPFAEVQVKYNTHVQNVGWQDYAADGEMAGTTGRGLRLEGMHMKLAATEYGGGIEYRTHIQNIGWESGFKANGAMSGTSGRALRLEAAQIRLTGEMARHYDIYYRVHAENFGWLGWAKNGQSAGTAGYGYRLEGLQVLLVPKGGAAPGSTANSFRSR